MNFKYKLQLLIYPFIIFPVILIILINFFINALKTKDMQYEILENHLNNILSICEMENDIVNRLKMNEDQYYSDAVKRKVLSEIRKNTNQNEKIFIIKSKTKKLVYFTKLNNDLNGKSLTNIKYIDDMINKKNGRIEFIEQIDEKSKKKNIAVYKYYPEWDWLVAVSLSKDNLYKYVYSATYLSLIIVAIFLIILIIILYMISFGITKPLEYLEEGTIKIAQNDYNVKINITSNDEFGSIAKKFNIMADKIKEYSNKNNQIIKELQESENRFRWLTENAKDMIYRMSLKNGRYEYVSKAAENITGYKADEFYNNQFFIRNIIHPDWQNYFKKEWKNLIKGSMSPYYEYKIIDKSGKEKWLHQRNVLITDENKKPIAMEGIVTDITERKQTEEDIKRERTLLKRITETSPIGITLVNPDGMITFANNQAERILGLIKDEITQRTYNASEWQITDFDGGAFPDEKLPFQLVMTGREPIYDVRHAIEWPDGRRVYLSINGAPLFDESGKIESIVFSLEDITERKQAEEKLRESEKKVRRKLNAVLSPEADIGELELSDIIDSEKIQTLMDKFYQLTNVGIGIIDLKGNVLVGTGWQDICTKFHRVNKESCRLCIESDLELSQDVPEGTFKQYKCKNNMWDIATPIMLSDRHVGNIFLGQFLYDDEKPNYEIFRQQARRYGFDEKEYIAALNRVPRWSREKVGAAMAFYTIFAGLIGNLSYSNIKLAKALEDRRRAGEALRKNEERYRMAQEIGHIGNWEYNLKTTEFWGSDEAKRIYGFDLDQLNFSTDEVENCIPERDRVHQALVDLIERDKPYNLEFEIHPLNSSKPKIIMSIAELLKDENGAPFKVIGVIQDITARKQAEECQILSLKILKTLNDKISKGNIIKNILMEIKQSTGFEAVGIRLKQKEDFPYYTTNGFPEDFIIKERYLCSKDTKGNITHDNNGKVSYECLCGYILSQKKFRKKSFFTRNGSFWTNNSTILIKKKLSDDLQIKIRGQCIEEGYESIALIPIRSEEKIIGLLQINDHRKYCFTKEMIAFFEGLASSIGIAIGRKNVEEEICKLNQELEKRVKERTIQLEAANKELKAFAYSVSHDLRAPLRSINGFCQFLLEEYFDKVDTQGKNYLQRVYSSAQQMGQIIEDMLNLSRVTQNEMEIKPVNLSIIIKDIAGNYCKNQPERCVDIIIQPDIIVNGDANLFRIALENLFGNAWKFTSHHTKARIEFGKQKQQDKIVYFIKDDGAGFDTNYSKKLFLPFQRLHASKEFSGTGIGLAIVKRIIDRHGGNIWAEGKIEKGAVFYFTLP